MYFHLGLQTKQSLARTMIITLLSTLVLIFAASTAALAHDGNAPFLNRFTQISEISSTIPANGDVNPYGVVVTPRSVGKLVAGSILVSNFNNSANLQGTGTTIVQISPNGTQSLFTQINPSTISGCPGGVGLTTALAVLKRGWVIVGSLPTTDGTSATAQPGCLIVLNSNGNPVETFSGFPLLGAWDATISDNGNQATLFVSNVLVDTVAVSPNTINNGNVTRIKLDIPKQSRGIPHIRSEKIIGTGFAERTDPNALVLGPTGLGLDKQGTLYVADTVNSRIAKIPDALNRNNAVGHGGQTVTRNGLLNQPLGLTIAPDGHILTVNGGNGLIVETSPNGTQLTSIQLDNTPTNTQPGAGCLFGVQVDPFGRGIYFVDDCSNTLDLLH